MTKIIKIQDKPISNYRPEKDGVSDKYSWLLFKFLEKNKGNVKFFLSQEGMRTFDSNFVTAREVFVSVKDDIYGVMLNDIICSNYRKEKQALFDKIEVTTDFLEKYEVFGRFLFSESNDVNENKILKNLNKQEKEHFELFKITFFEHLNLLNIDKNKIKIDFIMTIGSLFNANIFIGGSSYQNKILDENEYVIGCKNNLFKEQIIEAAAHEARHLWQHYTQKLKIHTNLKDYFWLNSLIEIDKVSYTNRPYEIDAKNYQKIKNYRSFDLNQLFLNIN